MIPYLIPFLPARKTLNRYIDCIYETKWLTNFGPLHNELTEKLSDFLNAPYLLLTNNGTSALQVAYKTLNVTGNVITSPFSFVASTSTLVWEGLNPRFVDIEKQTYGIDPNLIKDKDFNAILAVHVYGKACQHQRLADIATNANAKLIYDGAHAFGSYYKGKPLLSYGDASTVSFHATKLFHSVEGGAIVFSNQDDYDVAKKMINFGINENNDIELLGMNAKMSELHAAMGLAVFDNIDEIMERRLELLAYYQKLLPSELCYLEDILDEQINGIYCPILLKDEAQRKRVEGFLSQQGVGVRRYFTPSLEQLPYIDSNKFDCPVSRDISGRVLCLPLYHSLTFKQVQFVCQKIEEALR